MKSRRAFRLLITTLWISPVPSDSRAGSSTIRSPAPLLRNLSGSLNLAVAKAKCGGPA